MLTQEQATPTRPPIRLAPDAIAFAPGPDQLGAGYKLVMDNGDGGRLTHDLHASLPAVESFPMLAHRLRSVVGLGLRARVSFWVEPVRNRR